MCSWTMLVVGQWGVKKGKGQMGIGGCLLLLSVGTGDRIPVGRPINIAYNPWQPGWDDSRRFPTWAYKYDVVSDVHNDHDTMYHRYMNELDSLLPDQVIRKHIALHYSVM